jgi:hypothetical protein
MLKYDMDTVDNLGSLFDALTVEKVLKDPLTPPFTGYGPRPEYWDWWPGTYPASSRNRKHSKDVTYTNLDGKIHRLHGPAYISRMYNVEAWFKDGERHRENGPAYTHNRNMIWFQNGKLHRLDGPAVIERGGPKQYWIDGIKYSKKQYNWEIQRRKRKGIK